MFGRLLRVLVAQHLCKTCLILAWVVPLLSFMVRVGEQNALSVPVDVAASPGGVSAASSLTPAGATAGGLTHFMHLSDTHLAPRDHPNWVGYFENIMFNIVPVVDPSFIVHTGDMIEAKDPLPTPFLHTIQLESEWIVYRDILNRSGWFDPTRYVDMRGNHDSASVPSRTSAQNLFMQYGVSGGIMRESADRTLGVVDAPPVAHAAGGGAAGAGAGARKATVNLRFVVLDQAPVPGLSMPYNTMGYWSAKHNAILESVLAESKAGASVVPASVASAGVVEERYDALFVAGHYPSLFMTDGLAGGRLFDTMARFPLSAYLTGHYHQARMWTRCGPGGRVLQLEADDIYGSQAIRVMAVDHGLMSFVDTFVDVWPIVLVTSPKDARLLQPHEPNGLVLESTHVRLLLFSPAGVNASTVRVEIDGTVLCDPAAAGVARAQEAHDYKGLFTCAWDPRRYVAGGAAGGGTHRMRVTATDGAGRAADVTHVFSVDGTGASLGTSSTQFVAYVCLSCAYDAFNWLVWVFVLLFGLCGGFHWTAWAARRKPEALRAWRARVDLMRRVEAEGHTGAALAKAFPGALAAGSGPCGSLQQWRLYAGWNAQRHMWRFSELPRAHALLLTLILVWEAVLPLYLGPFVVAGDANHGWGVAFWWGVVGGDGASGMRDIASSLFFINVWFLSAVAIITAPADTQPIGEHSGVVAGPGAARGGADDGSDEEGGGGGDGPVPRRLRDAGGGDARVRATGAMHAEVEMTATPMAGHSSAEGDGDGSDDGDGRHHETRALSGDRSISRSSADPLPARARGSSLSAAARVVTPACLRGRCCAAHPSTCAAGKLPLFVLAFAGSAYVNFMLGDGFTLPTLFLSPFGLALALTVWWMMMGALRRDARFAAAAQRRAARP